MSSILEALKKLEDEKAGHRRGGANIAAKVAKPGRRPGQRPRWLLPAGMAVVAATAAFFTYMLMGGFSSRTGQVQPAPPAPQTERAAAPTLPIVPTAPTAPATPVMPTAPTAARAPGPVPPAPAVIVRKQFITSFPSAPASRQVPAAALPPAPQVEPRIVEKPAAAVAPAPPVTPANPPALKVTGIGWQRDNADRMAIVNGRAVAEGAVVEGARVEEIFPDRVRFSFNDKTFEIPLGKIAGDNSLP